MIEMKHKLLNLTLVSLMCISSVFTVSNVSAAVLKEENIAQKKKAYAISSEKDHDVSLVTDGDVGTYWQSGDDWNRWIEIDLDGIYSLSEIQVFTPEGYVSNYDVYVSEDNDNYTKVISKVDDVKATEDGDIHKVQGKACKIRINITYSSLSDSSKGSASQVGYINEIKVYGSKVAGSKTPAAPEIQIEDFNASEYGKRYYEMENDSAKKNKATITEVYNLIGRVAGKKYKNNFKLELVSSTTGKDQFSVEQDGEKIKISGCNGISLASGFNYYLKNFIHVNYDPIEGGSKVIMPETLPKVYKKVVKETPYDYKYLNNFCTPSYTYAFWNWDEYEPYIDWCAMNGVNLMLDFIGQEEVQRKMLKEFGYSDEEIKNYIPGPAYYGWFYMGNMSSFGGPLPNDWFEQRTELGRKVHERMYVYGISPVFVGYAGQVPEDFKEKNPDAEVIEQGYWPGGNAFVRPPVLKTYVEGDEVDYFDKVATVFYKASEKTFGNITPYFAIDPFHEGGKKSWVDENGVTHRLNETKISSAVQKKMLEYREDVQWIVQNWQNNPTKAFLDGVDKKHTIVLDLYADNQPHYQATLKGSPKPEYMVNDYDGTPWIWGMLHSFGGRIGFSGMPEILTEEMPNQLKSDYMKGIGVTAESVGTNPMLYELIYDMGWENGPINLDEYISDYFLSRYGVQSNNIEEAWKIMRETAYHKRYDRQRAEDSIINAQPSLDATTASGYITAIIDYDKEKFEEILKLYLKEYDKLKDNESYLYDLADITRQVLQNSSYEYLQEAKKAWNNKNAIDFEKYSNMFLYIILLQDQVLSTTDEFSLGNWIDMSRSMLDDADDWTKDLFEANARLQVTSWGSGPANGMLKDYSNRQWSGLTKDYYYGRWALYFEKLNSSAKEGTWNKNAGINWFAHTYRWANLKGNVDSNGQPYLTEKDTSLDISKLAKKALDDYSVTKIEKEPEIKKENIALGMPVTAIGSVNAKYPANNITDGDNTTLWMNNDFKNASVTIDFGQAVSVDGLEIEFKTPEEDRRDAPTYAYKVEIMDEKGVWVTIDDKSDDISQKDTIIPVSYDGYLRQVKVSILDADFTQYDFKPCLAEVRVFKGNGENLADAENIALNKKVTAERTVVNPSRTADKVVDGNKGTIWASGSPVDSWIMVDLGNVQRIDGVGIYFEKGKTPKFGYKLELLNEKEEVIKTIDKLEDTSQKENMMPITVNGEAQYVRLTLHKANNETAYPALAEFEIYQKSDGIEKDYNVGNKYGVGYSAQSSVNKAENVIDGNIDTRWGSGSPEFPQYLSLNAGVSITMDEIDLVFPDNLMNRMEWQLNFYDVIGNKIDQLDKVELIDKAELIKGTGNSAYHRIKFNYGKSAAKVEFLVNGVQEGDTAWAGLAEFNVVHYAKDLLRENERPISVNGSSSEKVKNLYDSNNETFAQFSGNNKSVLIDLENKTDIEKMTIVHSNDNPLLYKLYESQDGVNFKLIADRSVQTENNNIIVELFGSNLSNRYIKIEIANKEDVTINEVYIYRKDYSKQFKDIVEKYNKQFSKFEKGYGAGQVPDEIYDEALNYFYAGVNNEENYSSLEKLNDFESQLLKLVDTLQNSKVYPNNQELLIEINKAEMLIKYLNDNSIADIEKATLEEEVKNARLVYDKYKVSQEELDQAKQRLSNKYTQIFNRLSLKQRYDLTLKEAEDLINTTEIGDFDGNVSENTMESFKKKIDKIKSSYTPELADQEIEKLVNDLNNAIEEFNKGRIVIDTSDLETLIMKVDLFNKNDYAKEQWDLMISEYNQAVELLKQDRISKSDLDEITNKLSEVINSMEKLNKEGLLSAINTFERLDSNDYYANNWEKIEEVTLNLRKMYNGQPLNQSEIDDICHEFNKLIGYKKANYDKVDLAIEKVKSLDESLYKNFDIVNKAISKVVRGKYIFEQNEVDAMAKAITDAISKLEKKGDTSQPDVPVDPNQPVKPTPEVPNNENKPGKEDGAVDTSDSSQMMMWMTLTALAGLGFVTLLFKKRKIEKN